MNAVRDADLDDTAPTLKIVQMPITCDYLSLPVPRTGCGQGADKVERMDVWTPPGGRSIERPHATGRNLWDRRTALVRSYQQQASTAARPVPRTDPEQANVTPKPWLQTNDIGLPDIPTQPLQAAAKSAIKVTPDIPDISTQRSQVVVESTIKVIPDIPDMSTQRLQAVVGSASKSKAKKNQKKSFLGYAVRTVVTVLLFAFLLRSMNWSTLVPTLIHVKHTYLLIGLSAGILCVFFSAYGWRSLVLAENIQTDLARLIDLYLVGISFSHFLPTSMGGDAAKAYYLGRDSGNTPGATSAVLMSRITSFVGMLLIALPALAILRAQFTEQIVIWFLLLSMLLITAIVVSVLAAIYLPRLSSRFLKGRRVQNPLLVKFLPLFMKFLEVGEALSSALKKPRSMFSATLFGMLFWGASFLNYYGYALALGLHVPLTFYLIAIPFVSIIAALPISINGFGVREGAFVYLFTAIHVSPTTSLTLALLMDTQVLLFGLIGACIYFTMSGKKR